MTIVMIVLIITEKDQGFDLGTRNKIYDSVINHWFMSPLWETWEGRGDGGRFERKTVPIAVLDRFFGEFLMSKVCIVDENRRMGK